MRAVLAAAAMTPADIATAYRRACALDVEAAKPGNVSRAWPGHGMTADDFLRSADASAPVLADPVLGVGARIEAAIDATWAAVGCNTNLGIVLLCAPLAKAAASLAPAATDDGPAAARAATLHAALQQVLAGLDVADADAAFRAIARARPAGLGRAEQGDVHAPARVTLLEAMRLAAGRDLIARQYAEGYAEQFTVAWPAWGMAPHGAQPGGVASAQAGAKNETAAMVACYLGWLARHPDSHIVRKHGEAAAQSVTLEARRRLALLQAGGATDLAAWDADLKARGLNPGTSADLSVATAFITCLCGASNSRPAAPG